MLESVWAVESATVLICWTNPSVQWSDFLQELSSKHVLLVWFVSSPDARFRMHFIPGSLSKEKLTLAKNHP